MKPCGRRDELTLQHLGEDVLFYDHKHQCTHSLNKITFAVWENCDGKSSVADIAEKVHSSTKIHVDESIVFLAIEHLNKANLLEPDKANAVSFTKLSRRKLLQQATFAAVALPLISSMKMKSAHAYEYVSTSCASSAPAIGGGGCSGYCNPGTTCKQLGPGACSCFDSVWPPR
jgi:hypothetical protein